MRKRRDKNRKKSRWIIIACVLGVVFLIYFFLPTYLNLRKHKQHNEALDKMLVALEKENSNLKAEIYKLKNDPLYIEKIAREELGMMRPGEVIYRIVPQDNEKQGKEKE